MRKMLTFIAFTLLFAGVSAQQNEWQDQQVNQVNRQPKRAYFIPHATSASALTFKRENSEFFKLLNGNWKFFYAKDVAEKPADFLNRFLMMPLGRVFLYLRMSRYWVLVSPFTPMLNTRIRLSRLLLNATTRLARIALILRFRPIGRTKKSPCTLKGCRRLCIFGLMVNMLVLAKTV